MNLNQDKENEEILNEEKLNSEEKAIDEKLIEINNEYKFGWSSYSEIINGRFAMLGFLAIILIELFSQKPFLTWAGIF